MELSAIPVGKRFDVLERVYSDEARILFRAHDNVLQREVVLKLPGAGLARTLRKRSVRDQVLREARALAKVHHPGVVQLFDVVETAQGMLLVLEPAGGELLSELLEREGPLEPSEAIELAQNVAEALAAVHAQGLVHRGISTGCVMIQPDGTPRITGFHFVKLGAFAADSMSISSLDYRPQGARPASPAACRARPAPEQILGQKADARSDVFSLGWLLFEILTGESPYDSPDPVAWDRPQDLRALAPRVPPALARIVQKCLEPSPSKRYQHAGELVLALERLAEASPAAKLARKSVSGWIPAAAAVALAVGGAFAPRLLQSSEAREVARGLSADAQPVAGVYQPSYAASRALLIGIGDAYAQQGIPPLRNTERDVAALGARLAELEHGAWQVRELVGNAASRAGILTALEELATACAPDDRVFIYYAGHGEALLESSQRAWIVPSDGRSLDADPARTNWVSFDELFLFFERTAAKHVLVAMDCCYGGKLSVSRSAGRQVFEERYLTGKAHVVITSGRANEVVVDGPSGGSSPFAEALLAALDPRGGERALTAHGLFAEIQGAFDRSDEVAHRPTMATPSREPASGEFVFFVE